MHQRISGIHSIRSPEELNRMYKYIRVPYQRAWANLIPISFQKGLTGSTLPCNQSDRSVVRVGNRNIKSSSSHHHFLIVRHHERAVSLFISYLFSHQPFLPSHTNFPPSTLRRRLILTFTHPSRREKRLSLTNESLAF